MTSSSFSLPSTPGRSQMEGKSLNVFSSSDVVSSGTGPSVSLAMLQLRAHSV